MIRISDNLFIKDQLNLHSVDRKLLREIYDESISIALSNIKDFKEKGMLTDEEVTGTSSIITSPENKELFIQKFDDKDLSCMSKFINSELDFVTKGDRGLGRTNTFYPRLGALFRKHEYINTEDFRLTLVRLFLTNYLIGLIMQVDKKDKNLTEEELYEKWIPQIYPFHATPNEMLQYFSIIITYNKYSPLIEELSTMTKISNEKIADVIWGIGIAGLTLAYTKYWFYN